LEINFKVTKITDICRLSGSMYIKTPKKLRDKKCIVNVKNKDNKCFLYSILAILKKDEVDSRHRNRAQLYNQYLHELNYNEEDLPMKLSGIRKFERENPGLSINVLSWDTN